MPLAAIARPRGLPRPLAIIAACLPRPLLPHANVPAREPGGNYVPVANAGKSLGIKTVAVLSGIRNRERLAEEHPDFIVEDIRALPQIMNTN